MTIRPWDQRPDESIGDYYEFCRWVVSGEEPDPELAREFDWFARRDARETPGAHLMRDMLLVVKGNLAKHVRNATDENMPADVPLRDCIRVYELLLAHPITAENDNVDLSKYTAADLEKLLEAQRIFRAKR